MTQRFSEAPYTLRSLHEMLGLPKSTIVGFIREGFVTPGRGRRNEYRFEFQDLVLLRTAQSLKAASVPTQRVLRALRRLRAQLPATLPLTGLRIVAIGDDVVVRQSGQSIAAESGQLLFDFDASTAPQNVTSLRALPSDRSSLAGAPAGPLTGPLTASAPSSSPLRSAAPESGHHALLQAGERVEADDPAAAENLYRRAIDAAPDDIAPYLSLGALLYEAARYDEAVAVYGQALAIAPDEALLHFNRALALEDLGRLDDALDGYERCLAVAGDFADAHWNAARLYDQLQRPQQALQHFSAYRRLQR